MVRRRLTALLAVLAVAAATAVPVPTAAGEPAADEVVIDHGPGPVVVERTVGSLGTAPGPGAVAAVDVGAIRPGQGFALFPDPGPNFGGYRLQLVRPNQGSTTADVELVRPAVHHAAAELWARTGLPFVVDAAVGSCTGCPDDEHWPPSQPQLAGADIDAANVGTIRFRVATSSPCGPLALRSSPTGAQVTVGCASPSAVVDGAGATFFTRGSVWLAPAIVGGDMSHLLGRVVLHELGHALGLNHYSGSYPTAGSPRQLLYPSIHSDPSDLGGGVERLHLGDRNGVWYQTHPFGWMASAAYQDLLGRTPDAGGYRSWFVALLNRRATYDQFLQGVAYSNEGLARIVGWFYIDILGRFADAAGLSAWVGHLRQVGVPAVAAELYGSGEYYRRARPGIAGHQPGTDHGFVRALYVDILGRDVDPTGLSVWLQQLPRRGRAGVAHDILQSLESRLRRVTALYCRMLDRPPDSAGRAGWAAQLAQVDEIAVSLALASSTEYLVRSDDMALRHVVAPGVPLPPPCDGGF